MATITFIALAAACCWAIGVYAFPFRACGRCGGTGRRNRTRTARRRFDPCKRCDGAGRVQRRGSRLMHRAVLSARSELGRERQRRRNRETGEHAAAPRRTGSRNRP